MTHVTRLMLVSILLLAPAVRSLAQSPGCAGVHFSTTVLSRFPGAAASCLDVITRDGQKYAVFKAQLKDVRGTTVRLRVKNPDGTYGPVAKLVTKPGRKVLIDGTPYRVSELAQNQEITAYVRVDQPVMALPPANDTDALDLVPISISPDTVMRVSHASLPRMPRTASPLGDIALLGALCVALAISLRAQRKRHQKLSH